MFIQPEDDSHDGSPRSRKTIDDRAGLGRPRGGSEGDVQNPHAMLRPSPSHRLPAADGVSPQSTGNALGIRIAAEV
jgi:hypothetical protein